jgi:hypothetical protein
MVICQKWEESERGWGTRPDGYTLHLTDEHRRQFVQKHWDSYSDGAAPDEYSRPCGEPYQCQATEEVYQELRQRGGNRWYLDNDYPEPDGSDGWIQSGGGWYFIPPES